VPPNDDYFETFASAAGCNTSDLSQALGCLRSVPLDNIVKAMAALGGAGGTPSLGGYISEAPAKRLEDGRYLRIPVIATTNLDEGSTVVLGQKATTDEDVLSFAECKVLRRHIAS
jgi:carboxylesterase type B